MKELHAVIFDMDGTLFDTENIAKASWNAAARHFGFDLDENFHDQLIGLPKGAISDAVERVLPKDLDRKMFDEFKLSFFLDYLKENGLPIKSGALELLNYLKNEHIRCAIATSTWRDRLTHYFTYVDLWDYFEVIVTGDEVKIGKPNPDIYELVLDRLNLDASKALAIEDSRNGILSATGAGIDTIVVPDCTQPDYELLSKCLSRAENLNEVITIIQHL